MWARVDCPECDEELVDMTGGDGWYSYRCLDCGHRWDTWTCRWCGEKYQKQPDQYNCDNCGPNDSRIYK